ncbi:MAG: flagellar basal body-associated FliL family protein [Chthonomonadales bacterium]
MSKAILLVGVILLAAASGIIGAKVMVGSHGNGDHGKAQAQEEVGPKVTLDEFLVNLAGEDGHYLKTTIALGLKKGLTEESIKDDVPPIRDSILAVLSGKRLEEISTPAAREKLKSEIRDQVNRALGAEKVVKVYFTEFMTQ